MLAVMDTSSGDRGGDIGGGGLDSGATQTGAASNTGNATQKNKFQQGARGGAQYTILTKTVAGKPVPTRGTAMPLPHGAVVEVQQLPGNTQTAYSATTPDAAAGGSRAYHGQGYAAVIYRNITNLCDLWIYSDVAGEGVVVRVIPAGS